MILLVWLYTIIVFLLKITHWIDWSWYWIAVPLPATYAALILLVLLDEKLN